MSKDSLDLLGPLLPLDCPEVRAVAISSVDGKATFEGTSADLGSEMDSAILQAVRKWSDAVVVGAGTVRAENYGGVVLSKSIKEQRCQNGQDEVPPLVIVSNSLNIAPSHKAVAQAERKPILLTSKSSLSQEGVDKRGRALEAAGAEVVALESTSPRHVREYLADRNWKRIALEGGPSMYAKWLSEGAVDVFHLTIDPRISGKDEAPLLQLDSEIKLQTEHVHTDDAGCIFVRYRPVS